MVHGCESFNNYVYIHCTVTQKKERKLWIGRQNVYWKFKKKDRLFIPHNTQHMNKVSKGHRPMYGHNMCLSPFAVHAGGVWPLGVHKYMIGVDSAMDGTTKVWFIAVPKAGVRYPMRMWHGVGTSVRCNRLLNLKSIRINCYCTFLFSRTQTRRNLSCVGMQSRNAREREHMTAK